MRARPPQCRNGCRIRADSHAAAAAGTIILRGKLDQARMAPGDGAKPAFTAEIMICLTGRSKTAAAGQDVINMATRRGDL